MGKIDDEIKTLAGNVAEEKSLIAMDNLSRLMTAIRDGVEELLDINEKKEYYDRDLGKQIGDAVERAIVVFAKVQPPKVTVNPGINVDLTPINNLALEVSNQNKNIILLLNNIGKDGGNGYDEECYRLIVSMVQKNNSFVEKIFTQSDYSKQLGEISQAIQSTNEKPVPIRLEITERDYSGRIKTAVFTPEQNNFH